LGWFVCVSFVVAAVVAVSVEQGFFCPFFSLASFLAIIMVVRLFFHPFIRKLVLCFLRDRPLSAFLTFVF
jgi:hypothetical protein